MKRSLFVLLNGFFLAHSVCALPRYALVLFYAAGCPHCRRFDPVVKQWARTHHVPVIAWTLDGGVLPVFPDSQVPSKAVMAHFFKGTPVVVPTLFLADTARHALLPVLQGEASPGQLGARLDTLTGGRL